MKSTPVTITTASVALEGNLTIPENSKGIIVFVHGSGSSRFSPRNVQVARDLNKHGFATLLFDLLTPDEDKIDQYSREFRFDIELLSKRLIEVTHWLQHNAETKNLEIAYFGASTGAAAAIVAAAHYGDIIKAIVSRGGRPDLAKEALSQVKTPTLLIVGGNDDVVIILNQQAMEKMQAKTKLEIIDGATHLFEEPGTLAQVITASERWFKTFIK